MPEKETLDRARADRRAGKAPSTQAGEFVREEMDHIREGKHGARSTKQAIAIGLSKARRAGVKLAPPKKGAASERTRRQAERDVERGESGGAGAAGAGRKTSPRRSRASSKALQREGEAAASPEALSRQARSAASKRSAADRSAAAKKAARTKGPAKRSAAAKKAASTRARRS
jgi:hypothetical protein